MSDDTFCYVCANGEEAVVLGQIEAGKDPNTTSSGGPALQYTVNTGQLGVVRILLGAGADPNKRDHDYDIGIGGTTDTALTRAVQLERGLDMVQELLAHGADIEAKGYEQKNAVEWATAKGDSGVLALLNAHPRHGRIQSV